MANTPDKLNKTKNKIRKLINLADGERKLGNAAAADNIMKRAVDIGAKHGLKVKITTKKKGKPANRHRRTQPEREYQNASQQQRDEWHEQIRRNNAAKRKHREAAKKAAEAARAFGQAFGNWYNMKTNWEPNPPGWDQRFESTNLIQQKAAEREITYRTYNIPLWMSEKLLKQTASDFAGTISEFHHQTNARPSAGTMYDEEVDYTTTMGIHLPKSLRFEFQEELNALCEAMHKWIRQRDPVELKSAGPERVSGMFEQMIRSKTNIHERRARVYEWIMQYNDFIHTLNQARLYFNCLRRHAHAKSGVEGPAEWFRGTK